MGDRRVREATLQTQVEALHPVQDRMAELVTVTQCYVSLSLLSITASLFSSFPP